MELPRVATVHDALFPEHDEVSALPRLSGDDSRPGVGRDGMAGDLPLSFHQSADCLRSRSVLLLRCAPVACSSDCDWDELRALRRTVVPADCAALDGRPRQTFPGWLRVSVMDGVCSLGCGTAA